MPDLTEVASEAPRGVPAHRRPKWLLGAVARALRPGCKFDNVLILEGQQGLGKSTAFSIIGGEWTMDTPFSLSDKEGWRRSAACGSSSCPSSTHSTRPTHGAKSFFSRTQDRFRLPYAKRSTTFLRSCVFGATTNEDEYFRDPTGNRRYWPVHCSRKGYDKDAFARCASSSSPRPCMRCLPASRYGRAQPRSACIREQQRVREIPDPWVGRISRWLRRRPRSADHARAHHLGVFADRGLGRLDERSHGNARREGDA
jgi:putative DNA primase/helicase